MWYRFTFAVYNKVNVTDDKQLKTTQLTQFGKSRLGT